MDFPSGLGPWVCPPEMGPEMTEIPKLGKETDMIFPLGLKPSETYELPWLIWYPKDFPTSNDQLRLEKEPIKSSNSKPMVKCTFFRNGFFHPMLFVPNGFHYFGMEHIYKPHRIGERVYYSWNQKLYCTTHLSPFGKIWKTQEPHHQDASDHQDYCIPFFVGDTGIHIQLVVSSHLKNMIFKLDHFPK